MKEVREAYELRSASDSSHRVTLEVHFFLTLTFFPLQKIMCCILSNVPRRRRCGRIGGIGTSRRAAGREHASRARPDSCLPMAVSHAAAAAAGVTMGVAVGTLGFVAAKPKQPAIVGTWRREDDGSGVSGQLVYEPDGRVSSHLVRRSTAGHHQFVGFTGRWWLHNAQQAYAATYPPHDGPCVEHEVVAASSEAQALVGTSQVRKYEFTDNGQRLTTFTPSLSDTVRSRQHWRRIL